MRQESTSLIRGPLLSNPSCESLCTSTIQGIFLLTKDLQDPQRKHHAAWALSFLRNHWLLRESSDRDSSSNPSLSQETLVWDLSSWLRDLGSSQVCYLLPFSFSCFSFFLCCCAYIFFFYGNILLYKPCLHSVL